jgi:hypothetical protein
MSFKNLDSLLLEETERNKLYLAWLFYTNFDAITNEKNMNLLNQTWRIVETDLRRWFYGYQISLDMIVSAFKKIRITTDPTISLRYYPANDTLFSSILELFFSQAYVGKNKFVCCISWKLASQLVHEFDHYRIFSDNNLIGKEDQIERFVEEQGMRIEERAINKQIVFLEHCKNNLPLFTFSTLIKVSTWTGDGQAVLDNRSQSKKISKADMLEGITNYILHLRSDLKKNLKQYQLNAEKNNINQNRILLETLALYNKKTENTSGMDLTLQFY